MKFHITNFLIVGIFVLGGCSSVGKSVKTNEQPLKSTATSSSATTKIAGAALVFQRYHGEEAEPNLEAIALTGGDSIVLREKWPINAEWNMATNGKQLVFTDYPTDADFFDAGAWRHYVFTVNNNEAQKVLLAAYGSKTVAEKDVPDFSNPSYDQSGRRLILREQTVPQIGDYGYNSWVSLWSIGKRKRIFDSRRVVQNIANKKKRALFNTFQFWAPTLSPNGRDIVCWASRDARMDAEFENPPSEKVPPTSLVRFDLEHNTIEILETFHDPFTIFQVDAKEPINSQERELPAQFAWNPTQRKFIFVGPTSPTNPAVNLFSFDLKTRQVKRLTSGAQDDFSPQWSLDGKQIYWIRGSLNEEKVSSNRIWRSNSDGSGATAILPQITGITKIQLLPHLADWGRYRNIPIQSLAGSDK